MRAAQFSRILPFSSLFLHRPGLAAVATIAGAAGLILLAGVPGPGNQARANTPTIRQGTAFQSNLYGGRRPFRCRIGKRRLRPHCFLGRVYGGRQPISGSTVTAYEANPTPGGAATVIATATTASNGSFTFTSFNPTLGDLVYLTASGGDSLGGSGSNSAILLGTVAGVYCTGAGCNFPATVNINELSSAAMAYSMAGFTDLSTGVVNLSGTSPGIDNAALTFANLVNPVNGKARVPGTTTDEGTSLCTGSGEPLNCAALRTLDTLADIAAACVNTTDPSQTACQNLFSQTTPSGGSEPADTFAALYNVVTVPDVRNNASGIYGLSPNSPVYLPTLTAAPNDWGLALVYTGGGG